MPMPSKSRRASRSRSSKRRISQNKLFDLIGLQKFARNMINIPFAFKETFDLYVDSSSDFSGVFYVPEKFIMPTEYAIVKKPAKVETSSHILKKKIRIFEKTLNQVLRETINSKPIGKIDGTLLASSLITVLMGSKTRNFLITNCYADGCGEKLYFLALDKDRILWKKEIGTAKKNIFLMGNRTFFEKVVDPLIFTGKNIDIKVLFKAVEKKDNIWGGYYLYNYVFDMGDKAVGFLRLGHGKVLKNLPEPYEKKLKRLG